MWRPWCMSGKPRAVESRGRYAERLRFDHALERVDNRGDVGRRLRLGDKA